MSTVMNAARSRRRTVLHACALLAVVGGLAAAGNPAHAQATREGFSDPKWIVMPAVPGWYNGRPNLYLSTDTSDQALAAAKHLNYVPRLANAANTNAVDDIYTITNFTQSNIVPSSPHPEGPNNTDPNYTPLWQLSMVTWAGGTTPHLLTSEAAVKAAAASGLVTIVKTNIIINCPIIFTPTGGLFPGAHVVDLR